MVWKGEHRKPAAWAKEAANSAAAMIAGRSDRMDTNAIAEAFEEAADRGGGWVGYFGPHLEILGDVTKGEYRISIPDASLWNSGKHHP